MTFTVDLKSFERRLDDIAKKHLPDAARGYLNEIMFRARDNLRTQMEKDFDKPNTFTMSAFLVKKADVKDGDKMMSQVFARSQQEEYLRYQVFGGVRRKGDVGATPWDVVVGADKRTYFGNIPKGYLAKVGRKAKREKEQRAKLRGRRDAARLKTTKRKGANLRWITKSKGKPGTFFGIVNGRKGYWERPERSTASPIRQKGLRSVRDVGRLRSIIDMQDEAKYVAGRFKYDDAVKAAHRQYGTPQRFAAELERSLAKRRK
jgi:hypothetical protein